jgi:hypothetical protein
MIRTSNLVASLCIVLISSINIHATTITSTGTGGEWNATSTWFGNVVPILSDDVVIASGTSVSISPTGGTYNAQCKSLLVDGMLTHLSNNVLIGGGDGGNAPFIVNGTLLLGAGYNYSFVVNGYLKFNLGSTFNMPFGSIILNGNDGTAAGSVIAGQAILDVTNISTLNLTSGTIYVLNPHFVSGEPCIKGAKVFGATVSLGNNNPPKTPTDYIISNTQQPEFNNLEVNYNPANGTKARLSALVIKGVFGINRGFFYNAGGSEKIFVGGDMTLGNNSFIEGDIEFNGSAQQNINPLAVNSPSSIIFNGNLFVNSAKRVKIKLDIEIPLGKKLYFINGKFDTNNKTFTLNELPVNASSINYISTYDLNKEIGSFKLKNVQAGVATVFPIGYEDGETFSSYTPLTITSTTTSDFIVSAHVANKPTITTLDTVAIHWDINRSAGTGSADVIFQWNLIDEKGSFSAQNCKVYHYNNSSWDAITGNGANTNGSIKTKTAINITSFSPFTIFATPPLPVSLTEFKAKVVGNRAILTWSTASESNNQGFEVERSLDGNQFSKIGFVRGNGNSNILLSYIFPDDNFTQTAFYRLKQVDFDGKHEYSRIVQLEKTKTGSIKIYPNPIANNANLNIELTSESKELIDITLLDISGRVIFQNKYDATSSLINIPTQDLARGLYFVKVQNGLNINIQKIIKN